jgi:diphthine synthase
MLTFIGLGLYDKDDISVKGLLAIRHADHIFLDSYTSALTGTKLCELEDIYGKTVHVLTRDDVEQHPDRLLAHAQHEEVVFLTGGDPMVSTTHADLRIRAAKAGIDTCIIHGSSISCAICGLTGLQNYRFGKSCSVPFPEPGWFPTTPFETIQQNLSRNLHTLVYLDIQSERFMQISEAIDLLEEMARLRKTPPPALYVGVARAGSPHPLVSAGDGEKLRNTEFGPPLHILVIPADLHPIEREYLELFADL